MLIILQSHLGQGVKFPGRMTSSEKTRFVLVGLDRCGSNLLKFALKQNPQIFMIGEYFNKHSYPESLDQDGAIRAQAFFSTQYSDRTMAVGFKLFIHHGRKEGVETVWKYLQEDKEIRVIHLSRRNIFKRVLSLEVANVRGQWLKDEHGTDDIFITHSAEWWQAKIEEDEKKEQRLTKVFQGHGKSHIYYEDIVSDWDQVTSGIQEFLCVKPVVIEKSISKQEHMSSSEKCTNYRELQGFFQGSAYSWMFK